jgi:hypothetical protein
MRLLPTAGQNVAPSWLSTVLRGPLLTAVRGEVVL